MPAVPFDHSRQHRTQDIETSLHIGINGPVDVLQARSGQRFISPAEAGVVDQYVYPAVAKQVMGLISVAYIQNVEVTADPELIEQVLINLVLNAIQAAVKQPHPEISLSAHMDGRGRVVLHVSDNGQGIAEEALEKVFIPFFTTKKDGSGIGLSFSRQIMRLHRGSISVQSKPNEETVFTLRF